MGEEEGDAADWVLPLRSDETPEHDKAIAGSKTTVKSDLQGQPGVPASMVRTSHALALIAWLSKDAPIAAVEAEVDARAANAAALSDDTRTEREALALADLFALECEKESLIAQAHEAGTEILRRPDADPCAVLGVVAEPDLR